MSSFQTLGAATVTCALLNIAQFGKVAIFGKCCLFNVNCSLGPLPHHKLTKAAREKECIYMPCTRRYSINIRQVYLGGKGWWQVVLIWGANFLIGHLLQGYHRHVNDDSRGFNCSILLHMLATSHLSREHTQGFSRTTAAV